LQRVCYTKALELAKAGCYSPSPGFLLITEAFDFSDLTYKQYGGFYF